MIVCEKVWLEPQEFEVVVESLDTNKDNSVDDNDGVKIRGTAIIAGVPTRNGIAYTQESLIRYCNAFKTQKKIIPFLDSHKEDNIRHNPPFGHIEKLWMEGDKLMYQADIDPKEEMFLHKAKRGDISEVSIQAIVDQVDEKEDYHNGSKYVVANVRELLEISCVLIPGSRDSNMQFLEKLGCKISKENLHVYEEKYNLTITEKRLVEKVKKGLYNEQMSSDNQAEVIVPEVPEDDDEVHPNVAKPNKEDINTANSDGLYNIGLAKKIKKDEYDKIISKSERLKILTKRFSNETRRR